jgi:hypothetical protein
LCFASHCRKSISILRRPLGALDPCGPPSLILFFPTPVRAHTHTHTQNNATSPPVANLTADELSVMGVFPSIGSRIAYGRKHIPPTHDVLQVEVRCRGFCTHLDILHVALENAQPQANQGDCKHSSCCRCVCHKCPSCVQHAAGAAAACCTRVRRETAKMQFCCALGGP